MPVEFAMIDISFFKKITNKTTPTPIAAIAYAMECLSLLRYNSTYLGSPTQLAKKLDCPPANLARTLKPAIQAGFIKKHGHHYFANPNYFWSGNNNKQRMTSIAIWDNLGKTGLDKTAKDAITEETMMDG